MDDVITVCKNTVGWDKDFFHEELKSKCYVAPLTLEPSKEGVFLETEYEIREQRIVHRLKNENVDAHQPEVWRYQHFNSYQPYARKRATITTALWKASFFASDDEQLIHSAVLKLKEFIRAGYPYTVLKYCTNTVGSNRCSNASGRAHSTRLWRTILKRAYE